MCLGRGQSLSLYPSAHHPRSRRFWSDPGLLASRCVFGGGGGNRRSFLRLGRRRNFKARSRSRSPQRSRLLPLLELGFFSLFPLHLLLQDSLHAARRHVFFFLKRLFFGWKAKYPVEWPLCSEVAPQAGQLGLLGGLLLLTLG